MIDWEHVQRHIAAGEDVVEEVRATKASEDGEEESEPEPETLTLEENSKTREQPGARETTTETQRAQR